MMHRASLQYRAEKENKLTIKALFDQISKFIKPDSIVLAETGNALFSAAETLMPKGEQNKIKIKQAQFYLLLGTTFIGQGFYGSIGYTVGACLGTCIAGTVQLIVTSWRMTSNMSFCYFQPQIVKLFYLLVMVPFKWPCKN